MTFDDAITYSHMAWDTTAAEQRKPLPCGHPAACIRGGEGADPDAQVTLWCGWCASLEQVRQEEREKWLAVLDDIFNLYPELEALPSVVDAIKDAADDPR